MVKKICLLLLIVALLMSGCTITRESRRETEIISVMVVGVEYKPASSRPIVAGKSIIIQRIPAEYNVIVEYKGIHKVFDDKDLYDIYKDRVGDMMEVQLITIYYENGEVRQKIERSD